MLTKFQFHCSITCRDILYFVFWLPYCHTLWRHQYLICIIQKSWISLQREEMWQRGKHHSSSLLKAFQIRLFFNTSMFHFIGTSSSLYWTGTSLQWRLTRGNIIKKISMSYSLYSTGTSLKWRLTRGNIIKKILMSYSLYSTGTSLKWRLMQENTIKDINVLFSVFD